jgi:uncharacterized protein (TIGR00369 family)
MSEAVRAPFTAYIGGMADEIREGYVRLSIETGPQHGDRNGNIHTGVLTSLMDSVIGVALSYLRDEETRAREGPHATIEMSTSFYAAAHPGDKIIAEGQVLHIDGPVAFGEVEAKRASDDALLAKARLTFVIPGAKR